MVKITATVYRRNRPRPEIGCTLSGLGNMTISEVRDLGGYLLYLAAVAENTPKPEDGPFCLGFEDWAEAVSQGVTDAVCLSRVLRLAGHEPYDLEDAARAMRDEDAEGIGIGRWR